MPNVTNITPPRVDLIDPRTGYVSREWYRFFYNLFYATGGENQGAIPTNRGGTGTTQTPANGQILVGNFTTTNYNATDLQLGDGLGKTVGPGSLRLENTGVLSVLAGDGIAVDQETGNVTVSNDGVLSIIAGDGITVDQSTGNVTISAGSATNQQESQIATANQTLFTLTTMTYVPDSNTLSVYIDGVNQEITTAYAETSSTTVTFTAGVHKGARVKFMTA